VETARSNGQSQTASVQASKANVDRAASVLLEADRAYKNTAALVEAGAAPARQTEIFEAARSQAAAQKAQADPATGSPGSWYPGQDLAKIRAGQEDDFNVRNLSDIAETAAETSRVMTMLLGGIAAVSLLVGGIGIMNMMLVSVTERTREIGIRMAVGARSKHVQCQFLVEALILGLAGGLTGIAVGAATSYGVSRFLNWPQLPSPVAMIGSAVFSMLIGVFFGYYPAI
jgi:ABC-type antimicrobial peptide transport system permease subunit